VSINLSTRMRFVALGVAMVLVLVGWFGFVYHPGNAKLGKLRTDVAAAQSQATQLQGELARLQQLKLQAPQLRKDQAKFAVALPEKPAVSDFIRLVQNAANAAHLDFLSIAPSLPSAPQPAAASPTTTAPTPSPSASPAASPAAAAAPVTPATIPGVQTITIAITAKGTFFPLKDFVHRLEHLPRALHVTSFSVSGAQTGNQTPQLTVSLSMSIFESTSIAAPTPAPVASTPPSSGD
jgi:Tfp pilus assembly protein PilO